MRDHEGWQFHMQDFGGLVLLPQIRLTPGSVLVLHAFYLTTFNPPFCPFTVTH
jgi:hypothetical protein